MTKTTMFKQFGFTQFTAAAISGISCRALTGFWHTGGKAQEQIRLNKNKYNVLLSFEKTSKLFLCSFTFIRKEIIWAMRCEWFDTSPLQGEEGVRIPHGPFFMRAYFNRQKNGLKIRMSLVRFQQLALYASVS